MPSHAAEPIVGVDHVDAPGCFDVVAHPVGEFVNDVGQRFLSNVVRAGIDMHHSVAGLYDNVARALRVAAPHVDVAFETGVGQAGDEFTHVHIHTAGVARAWLG